MAHTPKLNDFIKSLSFMLKNKGVAILEVPYVFNLIKKKQIDTIYHEHYSYFSLLSLNKILSKYSLIVFNIQKLNTHGGSLRIFVKHINNDNHVVSKKLASFLN